MMSWRVKHLPEVIVTDACWCDSTATEAFRDSQLHPTMQASNAVGYHRWSLKIFTWNFRWQKHGVFSSIEPTCAWTTMSSLAQLVTTRDLYVILGGKFGALQLEYLPIILLSFYRCCDLRRPSQVILPAAILFASSKCAWPTFRSPTIWSIRQPHTFWTWLVSYTSQSLTFLTKYRYCPARLGGEIWRSCSYCGSIWRWPDALLQRWGFTTYPRFRMDELSQSKRSVRRHFLYYWPSCILAGLFAPHPWSRSRIWIIDRYWQWT